MTASEPSAPTDALAERNEIPQLSFEAYRNASVRDIVPLFVERETRERPQAHLR